MLKAATCKISLYRHSYRWFETNLSNSSQFPSKVIGILGGLGPSAGIALHQRIIDNTKSTRDQDHLPVLHTSFSCCIPDRTPFVLHQTTFNPAYAAFDVLKTLVRASNYPESQLFVGIPCSTFHSPVIFNEFVTLSQTVYPDVHILNMVDLTAQYIYKMYPHCKKVGLLSTSGTRHSNVYRRAVNKYDMNIIQIEESKQYLVHDVIYNPVWGVKAQSPVSPKAQHHLLQLAVKLIEQGSECIILGCTELPLAMPYDVLRNIPIIDPMRHLARSLIYHVDPMKLTDYTLPISNNLSKGLGYSF